MKKIYLKLPIVCLLLILSTATAKDRSSSSYYSRSGSTTKRVKASSYDCRSNFYRAQDISVRGITIVSFGQIRSVEVDGDLKYNQLIPAAEAGIEWAWHTIDKLGFNTHMRLSGGYWLQHYKTDNEKWYVLEHGYILDPSLGIEIPIACKAGLVFGGGVFIQSHNVSAIPSDDNPTYWEAGDLSKVTYFGPKGYTELRLGAGCLSFILGCHYQYWKADNNLYKTSGDRITLEVGEVHRHNLGGYFGIQYYP